MNHDRQMGFMWGLMAGLCIAAGFAIHPAIAVLAAIPCFGVWAFRNVH